MKLTEKDIISLVSQTGQGQIYRTIRGCEWGCEWIEQNHSGESDCYYIYREDNWDEFAYAVDWSDPAKYPNVDYLSIEEGDYLEAAE